MGTTGIFLTTPGGNAFWHPCKDAKTGFREMNEAAFVYGAAWGHPETKVEFGTDDGKGKFVASEVIKTGWDVQKEAKEADAPPPIPKAK